MTPVRAETVDIYNFGALNFRLLKATSDCGQHASITINAPKGTLVLGGGAFVDWDGPCSLPSSAGNLLTAMHPNNAGTSWSVEFKDHIIVSRARVIAYCIVGQMRDGCPIAESNYQVVHATSPILAHPATQANLAPGFMVVGGGARTESSGPGSLLFASYPTADLSGWIGRAKDHVESSPGTITVWAIGLKERFLKEAGMLVRMFSMTTAQVAHHPRHAFVLPDFHLTGTGARVNWTGQGNLLTASFPQDRQTVVVEAKDHIETDKSTITAFAIGFTE